MLVKRFIIVSVFCTGLLAYSTPSLFAGSPPNQRKSSGEVALLQTMGLPEDAPDADIVQCLRVPSKRILAASVIRYRKLSAATPELVKIVTDDKLTIMEREAAAEALCDFGNKDWILPIKKALANPNAAHPSAADPNAYVDIGLKIAIGGLLARVADYSLFEFVASHAVDEKEWARQSAILALANFAHKSNQVTLSAAEVLYLAATSDKAPRLRELAIRSLETVVKQRPELKPRLIAAAMANSDANDIPLRTASRFVLKQQDGKTSP